MKCAVVIVLNVIHVNILYLFVQAVTERQSALILIILFLVVFVAALLVMLVQRTRMLRTLQRDTKLQTHFFSGIASEFRTSLTIIQGLSRHLQELKEQNGHNSFNYLSAIERQGKTLSTLVNRLQDITGYSSSNDPGEWKRANIVTFMEMAAEHFSLQAQMKGAELVFFSEESTIETDFIPDQLHRVLRILLWEAVRSSNEGDKIFLIVERNRKENKKVTIKIVDHGKGYRKEDLPHIFNPFFKDPSKRNGQNGGNELALAKKLVTLHKGNIRVDSTEGKGSIFVIELPTRSDKQVQTAQWNDGNESSSSFTSTDNSFVVTAKELPTRATHDHESRTTILLVEDNHDIALYVQAIFNRKQYNLVHVANGTKALEVVNEVIPDIVITDINMPMKDGLELCRELRSSPLFNHIPIIIISARYKEEDRIEGLKCGADTFLRKPFSGEELLVSVEKLLESRNVLKEKYRRIPLKEKDNKGDENDKQQLAFLRQVTDIIHREMRNPNFSSRILAEELAISVSQLNRKLNSATGYPSSTFILQVKLAHARKILTSQNKTIGEVAMECGIFDVNYFSRIFKKHMGVTPTQYQRLPKVKET
jgi:DNA-binding response OmpR family regulator/signal transduction histidine kinase